MGYEKDPLLQPPYPNKLEEVSTTNPPPLRPLFSLTMLILLCYINASVEYIL